MNDPMASLPPGFRIAQQNSAPDPMASLPAGFKIEGQQPQAPPMSSRQRMRQTLSGNAQRTPMQPRSPGAIASSYGDVAVGAAQGAPSAALGIPGDLEGLGRMGLGKVGLPVSPKTAFPTTNEVGNALFGEPKNKHVAGGRTIGGFAGPGLAVKGARLGAKALGFGASQALGTTTGTGRRTIQEAFKAGKEGGISDDLLVGQMRGTAPVEDVVTAARDAVGRLRQERSAQYKAGIGSTIKGDATVLDFAPIDKAIRDSASIGQYKGRVTIGGAEKVWKKIEDVVDGWRQADRGQFHTAEGLDALKQRLNNLQFDEELAAIAGPGKPGAQIVNAVRNAVAKQIEAQAPGYAKVMGDYSKASDLLREVESGLSLGKKATVDTALRKLQSITRNNANTNYGQRVKMGEMLDSKSGGELMPQVSGQALSSWQPRGIMGPLAGAGGVGALATGNLAAIPYLALTSPRLVGEGARAAGMMSRGLSKAAPKLTGAPKAAQRALPHAARLLQQRSPEELELMMLLSGMSQ